MNFSYQKKFVLHEKYLDKKSAFNKVLMSMSFQKIAYLLNNNSIVWKREELKRDCEFLYFTLTPAIFVNC